MEKRQELMNHAVHFFSIKGFHQTSVQEIAKAAGISKGAFYKHFDSKEGIFVEILKQYHEDLTRDLNSTNFEPGLTNREFFKKKLLLEIERTVMNKEFFLMVFKDFPANDNELMQNLLQELRMAQLVLHKYSLLEVYGNRAEPFIYDLVTIFEGIKKEYYFYLIFENRPIDKELLAEFIVSSLDAIVKYSEKINPVLTDFTSSISPLEEAFNQLEEQIKQTSSKREKHLSAFLMLKEEMGKKDSKPFLIDALLDYLKQEESLATELSTLEKFI